MPDDTLKLDMQLLSRQIDQLGELEMELTERGDPRVEAVTGLLNFLGPLHEQLEKYHYVVCVSAGGLDV
jgi:hypothetical protein